MILALALPRAAIADGSVPLPAADLGQTNILDGEGGPGRLMEVIVFGSGSDRLKDAAGNRVPGRNIQRVSSFVLHPIFVSKTQLLGAYPGVEMLLPGAHVRNDFVGPGSGVDGGIGDFTVAPFLQWGPEKPSAGSLSLRAAMQVVAPTGSYNARDPVNAGHGSWQLSPYVAATWRIDDAWELSGRLIYDRSGNFDGRSPSGDPVRLRAGDFFVVNASTSVAISESARFGIGGYVLRQVSSSRSNEVPLEGSKQRVAGIGPVSQWQIGGSTLLLGAYAEFGARNRPEGVSATLRFQQPF